MFSSGEGVIEVRYNTNDQDHLGVVHAHDKCFEVTNTVVFQSLAYNRRPGTNFRKTQSSSNNSAMDIRLWHHSEH